ncbi:hypothetical protein GCM10009747_31200 [Agromyces humatus]|uniref:Mutator family transposase n=1 Tax=Agromyces humatus TaxID=279573 RepID=A0ABP4X5M2_9MICO
MGKELQRFRQVNPQTGEVIEAEVDLSALAEQLVVSAQAQGIELTGPDGLLTGLTRQVLQSALESELSGHLGYDRYAVQGRGSGNSRNGSTPKTVRTEIGEVTVQVPRDRAGTFEPQIVPKHQRRLDGFDQNVLSLYAKGMTTGDIAAHLAEMYGDDVSRDLVSTVTDRIVDEMTEWQSRPLDQVYPVILIDAIMLKIRAGTVGNRPVYVAMGIDLDGHRDVLGMWVGPTGGEGAKQWMNMLTELRNRGVQDVIMVCCDGLKGLPESIRATWPQASVQTCVVHFGAQQPAVRVEEAIRRPRSRPRSPASRSSPTRGSPPTRRWCRCGVAPGASSPRSSSSRSSCARSCTPRTRSNPSTRGSGKPSAAAGTSRTSNPR